MALRTILYGYKVENGKTVVCEDEAKIVKMVFSLYKEGKTLNGIAALLTERKIVYFQDSSKWNKNTINRMIENEKYTGNEVYPAIISKDEFEAVRKVKNIKSCKQEKHSDEVEYLRTICVCGKCGSRYKRVNTWRTREKWMCAEGCGCTSYIDDAVLENAITNCFNSVIKENQKIDVIVNSQYKPSKEVLKRENETIRLMEQTSLQFNKIANAIMQGATARFNCCEYDNGEITEELKEELSSLQIVESVGFKLMKKYIKQVMINPNGEIIAVFMNNAKVTVNGGAENAS